MIQNNLPKIIVISGATATGKSRVAIEVALKFNGAIINADALQIYQELPILSAQPSKQDKRNIPHFLYGVKNGYEKMSVAIWLEMVEKEVQKLVAQNKLPIIVGGTGMYISKLIDGLNEIPQINLEYRIQAQNLYDEMGHVEFQKIYGNHKIIDKQKLLRRAEIKIQTGEDVDYFQKQKPKKILENFKILHCNLALPREIIYQNCNKRFSGMINNGAIEEVKNFIKNSENFLDNAVVKTLGFTEIYDFLQNNIAYEKMIELATQKTRNYAKRQLTWFRHQFKEINFFDDGFLLENFLKSQIK